MTRESAAKHDATIWAKTLADMREAVGHDMKPIVLDIGFRVDSMKPRPLAQDPEQYHLITLNSTEHYLAMRGLMDEFKDAAFNLAKRLEVAYNGKRIPHSEFAMDDAKSAAKLADIYNELSKQRIKASTLAEDIFPRFFPFKCTLTTASRYSHMPLRHPVFGYVDEVQTGGQKKIILMEGAEIADTAPQAEELKKTLLWTQGAGVIARLRVNLSNAKQRKQYYRASDTAQIYPKLMFTIYGECQLAQNMSASLDL